MKNKELEPPWKDYWFAALLNLLCPGLGHFYWREVTFGLFIFLVTLIAVVLFTVTLLVDEISPTAQILMLSLPLIFYLFSYVDLYKSIQKKISEKVSSRRLGWLFLLVGITYQILAPSGPGNIWLRNRPLIYRQPDRSLAPTFEKDDWMKASRLDYRLNLAFVEKPILRALPRIFEPVSVYNDYGDLTTALTIGRHGESIEIMDGTLYVDGFPIDGSIPFGLSLSLDLELTAVNDYSIMVATFQLGNLDKIYQVPLEQIAGRASRLW